MNAVRDGNPPGKKKESLFSGDAPRTMKLGIHTTAVPGGQEENVYSIRRTARASPFGCATSEGGLRSWLAVRCTRTAALYLTAPPSCGGSAGPARTGAKPRSASVWSRMKGAAPHPPSAAPSIRGAYPALRLPYFSHTKRAMVARGRGAILGGWISGES